VNGVGIDQSSRRIPWRRRVMMPVPYLAVIASASCVSGRSAIAPNERPASNPLRAFRLSLRRRSDRGWARLVAGSAMPCRGAQRLRWKCSRSTAPRICVGRNPSRYVLSRIRIRTAHVVT